MDVAATQQGFNSVQTVICQVDIALSLVCLDIPFHLERFGDLCQVARVCLRFARGAGDDQGDAGLIDENGVGLVDDGKMKGTVNNLVLAVTGEMQ